MKISLTYTCGSKKWKAYSDIACLNHFKQIMARIYRYNITRNLIDIQYMSLIYCITIKKKKMMTEIVFFDYRLKNASHHAIRQRVLFMLIVNFISRRLLERYGGRFDVFWPVHDKRVYMYTADYITRYLN
jgi:hypothetical protein